MELYDPTETVLTDFCITYFVTGPELKLRPVRVLRHSWLRAGRNLQLQRFVRFAFSCTSLHVRILHEHKEIVYLYNRTTAVFSEHSLQNLKLLSGSSYTAIREQVLQEDAAQPYQMYIIQ